MGNPSETSAPDMLASPFWLWAVKITTLLCMLIPTVMVLVGSLSIFPLGLVPAGAYVWLVAWLSARLNRRVGLAGVMGIGVATILLALAFAPFVTGSDKGEWGPQMVVPLLIAVGAILSAIGAYLTMKQAPRDAVVLVKGLLVGAAFFLLVYVSFGNYAGTLMRSRQAQNQARAVVSLRKIHSCASSYQARYPDHGFPANLTMLGPEGEKCIDERLVKGRVAGYILTYTPGKRDGQGRIVGYSLAGHPGKFGIHGTQIYVSDHAELIHVTSEDRPAEATDPVVR